MVFLGFSFIMFKNAGRKSRDPAKGASEKKQMKKIGLFLLLAALAAALWLGRLGRERQEEAEDAAAREIEEMKAEKEAEKASPSRPVHEIHAWGDSMTKGSGSRGKSFPDFLGELTGIPTKNFGIGGEDSMEILGRCLKYGAQEEDVLVLQMGDNGGWKDLEDLIDQYRRMIREARCDRYIIMSSSDDPDDYDQIWAYTDEPIGLEDTWYEARYREVFGDHLFIGRKYLIEHGLEINGLEETEEDRARAEKGNISLQLRNPEIDNTHLNEMGYRAVAQGVYEQGKLLGYW